MKILDYEGLKQVVTKIKALLDKKVEKTDFDKLKTTVDKKVNSVSGKGLSTNDLTNARRDTVDELMMKNPPSNDFNSVTKQGIYNGSFSTNCPTTTGRYTLIVFPTDISNDTNKTNYLFQIAIRDSDKGTPFFRIKTGSSNWDKWYRYSTNDYTNAEKEKVAGIPSNPKYTDTTYSEATTSTKGLMSASDKQKINNLKEQVILTETECNALSDSQKNDASKIYFIKA